MNKLERLTGIVFILSRKSKLQAKELAEFFEVSERTIYRDIQALSELHVPVIAESGTGGGYSVAPEYFLQPMVFTVTECQAMFLGCQFIKEQKGFPLAPAATLALEKLETLLPKPNITTAKKLASQISYRIPIAAASTGFSALLTALKTAMENHQTIELEYQSLCSEQISLREVDPYRLFFEQDAWHLMGFCHLRQEVRQFKVARIKQYRLTEKTFAGENWDNSPNIQSEFSIVVRIKKKTALSQRIKESPSYKSFIQSEKDDAYLELAFPAAWFSTAYMIEIVLSFGKDAEIVSPPELREAFRQELYNIFRSYSDQ